MYNKCRLNVDSSRGPFQRRRHDDQCRLLIFRRMLYRTDWRSRQYSNKEAPEFDGRTECVVKRRTSRRIWPLLQAFPGAPSVAFSTSGFVGMPKFRKTRGSGAEGARACHSESRLASGSLTSVQGDPISQGRRPREPSSGSERPTERAQACSCFSCGRHQLWASWQVGVFSQPYRPLLKRRRFRVSLRRSGAKRRQRPPKAREGHKDARSRVLRPAATRRYNRLPLVCGWLARAALQLSGANLHFGQVG